MGKDCEETTQIILNYIVLEVSFTQYLDKGYLTLDMEIKKIILHNWGKNLMNNSVTHLDNQYMLICWKIAKNGSEKCWHLTENTN